MFLCPGKFSTTTLKIHDYGSVQIPELLDQSEADMFYSEMSSYSHLDEQEGGRWKQDPTNLASKGTFLQPQINYQVTKLTLQAETWKPLESHENDLGTFSHTCMLTVPELVG